MSTRSPVHALLAEFAQPEALLAAVRDARQSYRDIDAYAPYVVEGLAEALGFESRGVQRLALLGGVAGGAGAYFLQWYTAVIDYPINSGGRPLHSWPAFIPATFELTVLGAALAIFFGLWALNGLPRLYHPVFNVEEFDLASRNRFFLAIRTSDPAFDAQQTRAYLERLQPLRVMEVPE
ncbi:MAG: DUF3341 domain-containing protein [Pseudomonadota bacterium]|nr:DUF3341 domain-containing protein [Pseudomonadota bacterium]